MSHSQRASNGVGPSNNASSSVASHLQVQAASGQASEINKTAPASRPREEEEEVEEDSLVAEAKKKMRATRSDVWLEFTRIVIKKVGSDGKEVSSVVGECSHCLKRIDAPSANGTSGLRSHLKSCQKRPENQPGQRKITSIKTGNTQTKLANWKYDPDVSRTLSATMIAKHDYPINMVEHGYFREYVKSLNPSAKCYSRNTTREDIMKLYDEFKKELQEQFDTITSKCSFTTDLWTCKQTKDGYCCVTMHYINDEWKLIKKTLAYILLPSPHTGETLDDFVKSVALDWNIDNKLFVVAADNARSNDVMMDNLKTWLKSKDCLVLGGDLFQMRCSNHILHLIVGCGMKVATPFIDNIRECVKYVRSSQARKDRFANALAQVKLSGKSVGLDVDTRWNSMFYMLRDAIELRQGFVRLAYLDSDFTILPSSKDWQQGIHICECLQVFDVLSTKFAGIKYPTANMYYNGVYDVNKCIKGWETSPHDYIRDMGLKMRSKFDSYWKEANLLMNIGVVLDPRYKARWAEFRFKRLYGNGYHNHYNKFHISLNALFSSYESNSTVPDYFVNSTSGMCSAGIETYTTTSTRSDTDYDEFMMENSEIEVQKSELEKYFEDPLLPKGTAAYELRFDILSWWKNHAPKYPTLAKIARDVLAVPVTSVASESMFNNGGRVLKTHRSSLAPELVQALLCLSDWLPDLNDTDIQVL